MATPLNRPVIRKIENVSIPGLPGVHTILVKMLREAVYIKIDKEHWKSAYGLTWGAVYTQAAKATALLNAPVRKTRLVNRGLLR